MRAWREVNSVIRLFAPNLPGRRKYEKLRRDLRERVETEFKVAVMQVDGDEHAAAKVSMPSVVKKLVSMAIEDGKLESWESLRAKGEKITIRFGGDGSKGVVGLTLAVVSGECGKEALKPSSTHTVLLTRKDENYATLAALCPAVNEELRQLMTEGLDGVPIQIVFCADLKFLYAIFGHKAANAMDFCIFWYES